jgi:hypothetical protein
MTCKWLRFKIKQWWQWVQWPAIIGLVAGISLSWSVKSYLVSQNQQEVSIAAITGAQGNPSTITFSQGGEIRVYLYTAGNMKGSLRFVYEGVTTEINNFFGNTFMDTGLIVKANTQVSEEMFEFPNYTSPGVGWITVNTDEKCPSNMGGISIKPELDKVRAYGQPIVSVQCWADTDSNPDNQNAYNSYFVILSYKPNSLSSASPSPSSSPNVAIPDCTSLTTTANLNNLQVGTEYSFQLTAGGTAPITGVEMSVYGTSCSNNLKPYVIQDVSGPGTYTIKWTPTQTGPFTAYGRVWNDGITECRADCVDVPPRYLCSSAQACKLTGTVAGVTASLSPSPSSSMSPSPSISPNMSASPNPSFPPTQPDTGTPTWLTIGVIGLGVVLLLGKFIIKL